MTPFQEYAHTRWLHDFPHWSDLREDLSPNGEPVDPSEDSIFEVRYIIPSPANINNWLYVVFTADDIIVKFAVPGSHEHYDPGLYGSQDGKITESERWNDAYTDAMNEYIRPVTNDELFIVSYGCESVLVSDVKVFLERNGISKCQYESWSKPPVDLNLANKH
ncbi:hypothetical protein [Thalassoroseus pseudoceratinae]|uniref:hypothetical protein n=1 Tax=Thalassoroseus pseudoceratinae TaxID=2713176 RepID=UPI0014226168|nr:hypothetical protein [Thalassoroseus pseudoceratinae]